MEGGRVFVREEVKSKRHTCRILYRKGHSADK